MDKLPELGRLSEQEKDALIGALWAEVQRLQTRVAELEAKLQEPVKDARHSSVPPVKPIVTLVEQYRGRCTGCGQPYVAPVPAGMERASPLRLLSRAWRRSLRYTHAISDERLSALLAQVFGLGISEGGLANLFQVVKGRLDQRVAEILTRLRRSRLIGSDETSARVNG